VQKFDEFAECRVVVAVVVVVVVVVAVVVAIVVEKISRAM
jgi:hypothetical protein